MSNETITTYVAVPERNDLGKMMVEKILCRVEPSISEGFVYIPLNLTNDERVARYGRYAFFHHDADEMEFWKTNYAGFSFTQEGAEALLAQLRARLKSIDTDAEADRLNKLGEDISTISVPLAAALQEVSSSMITLLADVSDAGAANAVYHTLNRVRSASTQLSELLRQKYNIHHNPKP